MASIIDKYVNKYNYIRNKILIKQNKPLEFINTFNDKDKKYLEENLIKIEDIYKLLNIIKCNCEDQEIIYTNEFIPVITNEKIKYSKCYTFDGENNHYIVIYNNNVMYCNFKFSIGENVTVLKIINKEIPISEIHKLCLSLNDVYH